MPTFIYRCPNTGYQIQGFVADNGTERGANTFEAIECVLCKRVHLVNPETGDPWSVEDTDACFIVRDASG